MSGFFKINTQSVGETKNILLLCIPNFRKIHVRYFVTKFAM